MGLLARHPVDIGVQKVALGDLEREEGKSEELFEECEALELVYGIEKEECKDEYEDKEEEYEDKARDTGTDKTQGKDRNCMEQVVATMGLVGGKVDELHF